MVRVEDDEDVLPRQPLRGHETVQVCEQRADVGVGARDGGIVRAARIFRERSS